MTIVTKDSELSNRIILSNPPPRKIHFSYWNLSMKAFHHLVSSIWDEVEVLSNDYKLVVIFSDKIEAFI
ncbi:DUF5615 family PIN-like protein [Dyadobacter bucti]|uniref:DUF5615 family PIN-like protein n=1 Tax=Dyadobacter bucti TaxID=2572203 RepID=UPI001108A22C|nr:DUF5615 family PIN-like protein [Dyadobacter bucti]